MNIVDTVLAQAAGGSANGQGFGDWFARGQQQAAQRRQLNQSQQRIDIERLQEQARQTLLPAQQALLQQRVQMGKLQIDQTLQDRQDEINTQAAFGELMGKTGDLLQDNQPAAALAEVLRAGGQNPQLAKQPRYQSLLKDIQLSAGLNRQADQLSIARDKVGILQQNADTGAQRADDLAAHQAQIEALRSQGNAERQRHNLATEKAQQQKFALIGQSVNHLLEKSVGSAISAEIKAVSEDISLPAATKHRKIADVISGWEQKRPEAFTPQARAVLSSLVSNAAPEGAAAPAAASPAAQPAATHVFDPDTGTIVPVGR